MAQLLHGSATTTARTRAEFQKSEEPVAALARRHGVNPKTVAKWRKRDGVEDMPMGPKQRRSTTLTPLEEAAIVAFRVQTRLPLDDVFCALKPSILSLTRSTLHRCLQRHGVSRLPRVRLGNDEGGSRATRSATSTSTFARSASSRARVACSWRWTAPPSSPSRGSTAGRPPSLPLPSSRR